MVCPYCGGEMERGFLQSPRVIFWSKTVKKLIPIARMKQGDLHIARGWAGMGCRSACLCAKCNKIMIDLNISEAEI